MTGPKPVKRRDPLLEAADALDAGHLTHEALRTLWTPEALAAAHLQDLDLGPVAALGMGAARGASAGASDIAPQIAAVLGSFAGGSLGGKLAAQAASLTPEQQAAVQATRAVHPHLTTAGIIAGAALPFLLTGGESAASLPGLSVRGTQTAIGAAQGAGLTEGGPTDRAVGALAGAALARYGPSVLKGAGKLTGKVAGRLPLVGSIFRGPSGAIPVVARAAEAAGGDVLPSGIAETAARASLAKQGFSPAMIEQALSQARTPAPPQGLLSEIPGSGGQGFEVTGTRSTPAPPTAPTVAEMTRPNVGPRQPGLLSSLGRGEQFPYYTRGGAAEQAIAPFPSSASPAASSLIPMQQLQMLLRLSPEEFEAAGGLFPKAIMDQLRQLRLANPGLLAAP